MLSVAFRANQHVSVLFQPDTCDVSFYELLYKSFLILLVFVDVGFCFIFKILNVFLWLKLSPFLDLNKIERFAKVSQINKPL